MLVVAAVMLMLPLPLPLSNALPAYAALLLAAGSMERDGYFIMAGYLMILLSVAYLAVVVVVSIIGVQNWLTPGSTAAGVIFRRFDEQSS